MAETSKIGWTDCTYNHWIGCTKVSPACKNCYAAVSTPARTLRASGHETWGPGAPRKRTKTEKDVRRWNKLAGEGYFRSCAACGKREFRKWDHTLPPGGLSCCTTKDCLALPESESDVVRPRVFCSSLSDWLDDEVPIEWLAELLDLIRTTPHLDWLLLTKRPENFFERMRHVWAAYSGDDSWRKVVDFARFWALDGKPLDHIWIGTTAEDQEHADKRIPLLLAIPASIRFLSCEPLLGEIDLMPMFEHRAELHNDTGIHWVIAGGESGHHPRPMFPDWARSLRDQCAAAGVPFFFKQWGEWAPGCPSEESGIPTLVTKPGEIIARFGSKKTVNRLDGRKWEQFPERSAR